MGRRSLAGIVAVTAALAVALGAPILSRAGLSFNDTLKKSHAGNFVVGGNGTFTITLSDSSGSDSSDTFTITDSLPTGLSYVTAAGPSFTCSNSSQVVTCHGTPSLTAGQTATVTVVAGVGSAASPSVTNTASFTDSFSADNNASDNTAVDPVTVQAASTSTTSTVAPSPSPSPQAIFTAGPARPVPAVPVALLLIGLVVLGLAAYGWHRISARR